MKHRIRRQVLELDLPRAEGARSMAQEASRLFQEEVLPQLDVLFTQLAPADRYIRIDRLEIDLRQIPEKDFARHFVEICVEQVSRQITILVAEAAHNTTSKNQARILTGSAQVMEILGDFLRSGTLPWRAKGVSLQTLEEKLQPLLKERSSILLEEIRTWSKIDPVVIQRLIWQFSLPFVEELLALLLKLEPERFKAFFRELETQLIRPWTPLQRQRILLELAREPKLKKLPTATSWEHAVQWWYESPAWAAVSSLLKPAAIPPALVNKPAKQKSLAAPTAVVQEAETEQSTDRSRRSRRIAAQPEGEPVAYAGLILLTPYISSFFNNLSVQPQAEQPESAFRAVHLLYHLATGKEQAEEPDLYLPKLLCGLSADEPVPQQISLTDTEKAESENLLRAVISNWPVLKNTTPDGLRSAFLQRDGLIYSKIESDDLRLVVERKSQDLLLERLPWGFSVVKFPWTEYLINVEW